MPDLWKNTETKDATDICVENAKKRKHYTACYQSKKVHETTIYVINMISKNKTFI